MRVNESIIEVAALEWFLLRQGFGGQVGEQTRVVPPLIPAFYYGEKEKVREARQLHPTNPEEVRATDKESLSVQTTSKAA